ncbi:MAG: hypothetical protein H0X36_05430, partial [Sphingomonadaceae bacterium]|nr:hypothetical protein [Sphingomonadaceae bacterium]
GTITRDEVRAAAGRRFDLLDPAHGGSLTLAGLPHTMAQRAAEHRAAHDRKKAPR